MVTNSIFEPILMFIVGFILLIKGGDWFVDGSTGLAHRFHVPEILIGATVVSIGTTLPEVMVSAGAAVQGHGEIAYGNAIGSIICNTALIAAISIAVKPSKVDRSSLNTPVMTFFIAALLYVGTAYAGGTYTRLVGILLLAMFVVYMGISIRQALQDLEVQEELSQGATLHELQKDQLEEAFNPLWKDIVYLVLGAVAIAFGANLLIDNGTIIATMLGVPESVIALTFVALGTSLPELVTAITSLKKGHGLLSLGNVIGANLFNLVLVSGLAITLNPFGLPTEKTINGINSSLVIDIPLMLIVMGILTLPALKTGKLSRWQGIILLILYAGFCAYQFIS